MLQISFFRPLQILPVRRAGVPDKDGWVRYFALFFPRVIGIRDGKKVWAWFRSYEERLVVESDADSQWRLCDHMTRRPASPQEGVVEYHEWWSWDY